MKKKNTMPEKDWQQTHEKIRWRELRKRILVMGLTVAMVANTVDLSALSVSAKTDESETGKTTIVSFEEISKDITEQTLPIGALESDIKFPTSLTVTVEKTTQADEKDGDSGNADASDNADSVKTTGSSDAAASSDTETTTEKIRLKNIKWELNVEESDAEEFDSSEASNGFCYAYTPVLPDEDGDGNQLVLGKDVELPTIYVLVGEYGIALLAGSGTVQITETNADGTKAPYTAQDLATWIGGHGSANLKKVSIKLLNDDASITSALTIGTGLAKEIELDLDGHTLKLADGARLYFKSANITITSSGSNKGTITGNYDYSNRFEGDGLVTADYGSMLTIERVTIENAGKGSTVAMWGGVTCTIDEVSISGSSGEQVGTITIKGSNTCTITNTEVTGNVASGCGTIMFMGSCSECIIGYGAVIKSNNSSSRCIGVDGNYSIKITIKEGAALTADTGSGTIMNISRDNVAVNIEGGTFNGRLFLPDNSQITGGTFAPASGYAINANGSNKTLQDLLQVGYILQYEDGTYANLTARWTEKGKKVTAVKSPLYFTTHPTISSGAELYRCRGACANRKSGIWQ